MERRWCVRVTKVRTKLLRDKNTEEIIKLKSSFRLMKCITRRYILKVWEGKCVKSRYFFTNWVLQSYTSNYTILFLLSPSIFHCIISFVSSYRLAWLFFLRFFVSSLFYCQLWKFSYFPFFKAGTNLWFSGLWQHHIGPYMDTRIQEI